MVQEASEKTLRATEIIFDRDNLKILIYLVEQRKTSFPKLAQKFEFDPNDLYKHLKALEYLELVSGKWEDSDDQGYILIYSLKRLGKKVMKNLGVTKELIERYKHSKHE
jgi:DNA-binding HxlR family transcriptional regulator